MQFIDECRSWWKLWSIRLAAVAGAIAAAIVASPQLLLGLIAFVPEGWRWLAAIITGALVFIVPALARLIQQPKLRETTNAE